jgi:hypothetical protein
MKIKTTITESNVTISVGADGYTYTYIDGHDIDHKPIITITTTNPFPQFKSFMDRILKVAISNPRVKTVNMVLPTKKHRLLIDGDKNQK